MFLHIQITKICILGTYSLIRNRETVAQWSIFLLARLVSLLSQNSENLKNLETILEEISFREDFVEGSLLTEVILSILDSPLFLEIISSDSVMRILTTNLQKSAQKLIANLILQNIMNLNLNEVFNNYAKILIYSLENVGEAEFNYFIENVFNCDEMFELPKNIQIALRGLFLKNKTSGLVNSMRINSKIS